MRAQPNPIVALASVAILLSGLLCQTAQAQEAQETLAELAGGGTLTVGDNTFSDFSYAESGLTSFNAADITVTASAAGNIDTLTWGGNISLASLGSLGTTATGNLLLNYVVTETGGQRINEIGQNYTGTVASGSATIRIAETVTAPNAGGATLASAYLSDTCTYEPDFSNIPLSLNGSKPFISPSQPILDVVDSISLGTVNAQPVPGFPGYYDASVHLSQIQQPFDPVPEPAATALLAGTLLLLPPGMRKKAGLSWHK
jgi:hypothetical protein